MTRLVMQKARLQTLPSSDSQNVSLVQLDVKARPGLPRPRTPDLVALAVRDPAQAPFPALVIEP